MHDEYDGNTVCHQVFITIHSRAYTLGYCKARVDCTNLPESKNSAASVLSMHESFPLHINVNLFHISFSFMVSCVSNTHTIYSALYPIRQY